MGKKIKLNAVNPANTIKIKVNVLSGSYYADKMTDGNMT